MNDLPLFIAIVIISVLLVLLLISNITFKLISIIKERKNVEEEINENAGSDKIRINRNDDNIDTGRLSGTEQVSDESIKEVEENYKMDEK